MTPRIKDKQRFEMELDFHQREQHLIRVVASNLKHYRNVRGMSHVELAEKSLVSRQTILKIEKPEWYEHTANISTLNKIAVALRITVSNLISPILR